jgi:hypothetical protein
LTPRSGFFRGKFVGKFRGNFFLKNIMENWNKLYEKWTSGWCASLTGLAEVEAVTEDLSVMTVTIRIRFNETFSAVV